MTSPRAVTAAALVTALIVPAACGGDDGEPSQASRGGAMTVEEYQKQGNALCQDALRKVERIPTPSSEDEIADYLERVFDASEGVTEEFAALEPPSKLRADHEKAVALSEETDDKFDDLVDRVREAPSPRAAVRREFKKLAPDIAEGEKINERLGLEECNEVGPPSEQPEAS